MQVNSRFKNISRTHEGSPAKRITPEQELRRSVLSCLLWEDGFYENGSLISDRIAELIPKVDPVSVASLAIEARSKMNLRHVPLFIVREMARLPKYKSLVSQTLYKIIQRADELAEFLAIYWKDGRQPLSAQVKKGLSAAFWKFDAYSLAKYNRDKEVKLRDVLFLCHPKPKDEEQENVWKKLAENTLESPDTWEVALSSGENKKETWERLLSDNKLGALALLRNLRNMYTAEVDEDKIFKALDSVNISRVLPFRFISAAKHAPQWESQIETAMFRALEQRKKLKGKTVLLVDVSGSMEWQISKRSDLIGIDVASGLAVLVRELCEKVSIYSFSMETVRIPNRRGFALCDALVSSQSHLGTLLGGAIKKINASEDYDRLIVLTDEKSHDVVGNPVIDKKGYMINIACNKNGVGYGKWLHIDGWSESVFDYMLEMERIDE